jgi:Fe-S-cluster-containing dehydrogenase component
MAVSDKYVFFLDPNRCIGCQACVQACSECDTHRGFPMIHLEFIDRARSTQTAPVVCMHCESPTCADVCPADAIKRGADGVVRSALEARCVGCSNCVLACPFGVPKMNSDFDLMMKCDLCYDRTSTGRRPMCASVCPSGALFYGTPEQLRAQRPRSMPLDRFQFGGQTVATKVQLLVPHDSRVEHLDVLAAMEEPAPAELASCVLDDLLYSSALGPT